MTLHVGKLRATLPTGDAAVAAADLSADAHAVAQRGETWLQFTLAATGVDLPPPPSGAWAFGPHIDAATLAGTIAGPSPPPSGVDDPPTPYALATTWRDGGGTLDLRDITIRWGTLDLAASATLALDADMQPAGTASLQLANPAAAIDTLTEAKLLPATVAMAVRLLAPQSSSGQKLDVSLAVRDRTLSLGPVRIARLPELHWPQLHWPELQWPQLHWPDAP